jgi:4-hydroxybenzoate polyprenyltransferase
VSAVQRRFEPPRAGLRTWIRAARIHQWVKNLLIFVPALLAHEIADPSVLLVAALAFVSFGLCASSVYVFNDLLDLPSDRRHPRKRLRPFAAGLIPAHQGVVAGTVLLAASAAIAASINLWFLLALAAYYVFTWAYSLALKRFALIDVMTLAGLYTMRIIAGSAATLVWPSFWLLGFSVFLFLSLGIVKRFAELEDMRREGKLAAHGRGYSADDLPLLQSLGTAAGYAAVVVMALYINSAASDDLYAHPKALWLLCPLMLFWISRVWLLTTRGQMHDDPIVFALKDRVSLALAALMGVGILVAL